MDHRESLFACHLTIVGIGHVEARLTEGSHEHECQGPERERV